MVRIEEDSMKLGLSSIFSYFKEDPSVYIWVVFFSVIVGLLEFIGISSLLPAIAVVLGEQITIFPNWILKFFSNFNPITIFFIYFLVVVVQIILTLVGDTIFFNATTRWGKRFTRDLLDSIFRADFQYSRCLNPGEVEVILARNLPHSTTSRYSTACVFSDFIQVLVYIGTALFISYQSVFLLVPLCVLILFIHFTTLKLRLQFSKNIHKKNLQIGQYVSEHIGDLRGLLTRKDFFLEKVKELVQSAFSSAAHNAKINAAVRQTYQPLVFLISLIAIFFWKGILHLPNSTILVVIYIFFRAAPKINATITRFTEVIEKSQIDISLEILKWRQRRSVQQGRRLPMNDTIFLKNVDIEYRTDRPLLTNVQFEVNSKEFICITGRSGIGKSTLIDVICGFKRHSRGIIKLGGVDYQEIDFENWRTHLGLLHPGGVIVSGTWVDNVSFLRENPDTKRVERLLRDVGLSELVKENSEGIFSVISARGDNLSAGQRQRLLLARMLYPDPDIFILDEPTSNLDSKTEQSIYDLLISFRGKKTIIIISHNDFIQQYAHKIYKITASGEVMVL